MKPNEPDIKTKMLFYSNPKAVSKNHESWSEAGFSWIQDGGECKTLYQSLTRSYFNIM